MAATLYRAALGEYDEIGDKGGSAKALNNLALILWNQGQLKPAKAMFDKALVIFPEIENRRNEATILGNTAIILVVLGDAKGAMQNYEDALEIWHDIGNRLDEGTTLDNIGDLRQSLGDLSGAQRRFDQARAIAKEVGDRSGEGYALFNQGEVLKAQGDLAGSRQKHEEALKIRSDLGEAQTIPASHLALAELAMEERRFAEGDRLANQAAEEFTAQKAADDEARAYATLARCQNQEGEIPDAQKSIEQVDNLSKRSQDRGGPVAGSGSRMLAWVRPREGARRLPRICNQ